MDCLTSGLNALIAEGKPGWKQAARFAAVAPCLIRKDEPSMVVGEPGGRGRRMEDEGRTVILPLPLECPKLYACRNETGGATVMLADEY